MAVKKDADFDTDMGSEDKDQDTGRKDADDRDDADDDDQDDDEEPTLEALKEELAKTKAALRKANREAERRRTAVKRAPARKGADDTEARIEGEVEKYRTAAFRTGASAALLAAGLKGGDDPRAAARRAVKLLDMDGVELTEDGDLDGLDDAIEELKADMPHLFKDAEEEKPARRRPGAGRIDAHAGRGNRPTGGKDQKSSAERLGEALRSGR